MTRPQFAESTVGTWLWALLFVPFYLWFHGFVAAGFVSRTAARIRLITGQARGGEVMAAATFAIRSCVRSGMCAVLLAKSKYTAKSEPVAPPPPKELVLREVSIKPTKKRNPISLEKFTKASTGH